MALPTRVALLNIWSSDQSTDAELAEAAFLLTRNHKMTSRALRDLRPMSVHRLSYLRRCGKLFLPDVLKKWRESDHLTLHHARAICRIPKHDQKEVADKADKYSWSVAKIQRIPGSNIEEEPVDCHFDQYATELSDATGFPSTVRYKDGVGELNLKFFSLDELDRIAAMLGYSPDYDEF